MDNKRWVLEEPKIKTARRHGDCYEPTWHWYPDGDYESAGCGKTPVCGSPIIGTDIDILHTKYIVCPDCWDIRCYRRV